MDAYRSARQFGVYVILLTTLFRLFEVGLPQQLLRRLRPPQEHNKKETGYSFRSLPIDRPSGFTLYPRKKPEKPRFDASDAEGLRLTNTGNVTPDIAALLTAPLSLDLDNGEPAVLILHTHTTESYTKSDEQYKETADYRTLDEEHNMLAIGDALTAALEKAGIRVIHDRNLHDYPSYTGAYNHARKAIRAALSEHSTIQLVLDLHRDAAEAGGTQYRTAAAIGQKEGAQIMFVLGCGNAGLSHPNWEQNLALALKLQTLLNRQCPGLCRPISLRPQRFNQDLSPGALLIEIGSAGNTQEEAMLAVKELAKAIGALKDGSGA